MLYNIFEDFAFIQNTLSFAAISGKVSFGGHFLTY